MTDWLPVPMSPVTSGARLSPAPHVPTLVAAAGAWAEIRFLEFFAATIRNPHTRRATLVRSLRVASWVERLGRSRHSAGPRLRHLRMVPVHAVAPGHPGRPDLGADRAVVRALGWIALRPLLSPALARSSKADASRPTRTQQLPLLGPGAVKNGGGAPIVLQRPPPRSRRPSGPWAGR